jgi:hypothetical protein
LRQPVRHVRGLQAARQNVHYFFLDQDLCAEPVALLSFAPASCKAVSSMYSAASCSGARLVQLLTALCGKMLKDLVYSVVRKIRASDG